MALEDGAVEAKGGGKGKTGEADKLTNAWKVHGACFSKLHGLKSLIADAKCINIK